MVAAFATSKVVAEQLDDIRRKTRRNVQSVNQVVFLQKSRGKLSTQQNALAVFSLYIHVSITKIKDRASRIRIHHQSFLIV